MNSFKIIGFHGGIPDSTLTLIGSMGALFNGSSKIIFGTALDFFKFKPVYTFVFCAIFTSLISIQFTYSNSLLYGLCICANFMGDGSMTSMLPVVTLNIFGLKRGTEVYGFMFSEFGFAAIVGVTVVTVL